jgi:hypothetical protein
VAVIAAVAVNVGGPVIVAVHVNGNAPVIVAVIVIVAGTTVQTWYIGNRSDRPPVPG